MTRYDSDKPACGKPGILFYSWCLFLLIVVLVAGFTCFNRQGSAIWQCVGKESETIKASTLTTNAETFDLKTVSQQYIIPKTKEDEDKITYEYLVCANGNTAYLSIGGDDPTVGTKVGMFAITIPSGSCMGPLLYRKKKKDWDWRIFKLRCAYVASSNEGSITFIQW